MPYIGKSPSAGVRQRYQYTATASQTTFSGTDLGNLTLTYTDNNFVDVFQNGVLLKGGGNDYTATSGTSVVLATGASASDVIEIIVYDVFSVGNFFNRTDSDSRYLNVAGDTMTGSLDLNGTELILDVDGDTSITSDTDDRVDIKVGGSDKVHIASTGLGVGTNAPTDTAGFGIALDVSSSSGAAVYVRDSGGSKTGHFGQFNEQTSIVSRQDDGNIAFYIGASPSEAMRIDSSGTLLVGRTADVSADTHIGVQVDSSVKGMVTETGQSDNTSHQLFINPNGIVGSIKTNGSATSFNTSSDYRLKENVVTDWDATTRLKELKPSRFNFKADKDTTVDGFIAHEVSSVVPEAISGEKDAVDKDGNIDPQGIDQSKLVPLLTKALQESIARADALEARIKKLEDG